MSASIAYVVYGISFTKRFRLFTRSMATSNDEELAANYFSSYDRNPLCLGVRLCSIYESEDVVDIDSLVLTPSQQDLANYNKVFSHALDHPKISNRFKQQLSAEVPKTFIVWGPD